MKLFKHFFLLIAACLSFNSYATSTWHYAKIELVGTSTTGQFVKLSEVGSNPTFSNRFFKFDSGIEDRGLAVALTAYSSGKQIYINTNVSELSPSEMADIQIIYATDKNSQ